MKKAIVIGASSGIGRELVKILAEDGYEVGIVARRYDLLLTLQKEINTKSYVKQIDIACLPKAMSEIESLIEEMKGVDLFIINAGIGFINPDLDWQKEKETIEVNVMGFCAMANIAMKHFLSHGKGHLVGISSISALRGSGMAPAYNASKAFVSNYLEGMRQRVFNEKKEISITDIKPGFVDTAMAKGEGLFWVASPQKAARQIYRSITQKRYHAYITSRWRFIAWLLKIAPRGLYDRLG